jgi:hypothetical protein
VISFRPTCFGARGATSTRRVAFGSGCSRRQRRCACPHRVRCVFGLLALLGAVGASAGGENVLRATVRVTFWGALAMALIAGIGNFSGTVV